MCATLTHTIPAKEIACWIAEIEREYPTLPRGERRIARQQMLQLHNELGIRDGTYLAHELYTYNCEQLRRLDEFWRNNCTRTTSADGIESQSWRQEARSVW